MTSTLSRPAASDAQQLTPSPSGRFRGGQWHWVSTLAVFAAVMLTSLSLNSVVLGWTWLAPVAMTVGGVLLVMGAARTVRLPELLVPATGFLALVGSLVWQFFPTQSVFGVFPGPGASVRLAILLDHAENTVVSQVAPVLPGGGIFMVVCAGVGLVAILADTLATSLRMPATSGLALLAVLVVPAVVRLQSVGVPAFLAAVVGYLLVLGCGQWLHNRRVSGGSKDSSGGRLSRGLSIGAAALAVTVLVPLAVPGFNVGAFPQGARVNLWGTATGLNPVVTLGNDLRNPAGFGRISYATNSTEPLYLRSVTLENFSGQRWEPEARYGIREPGVEEMGTGEVRASIETGVTTVTRISTESFTSPWLLAPYAPVGFTDLSGRWAWDPQNLSVIATDGGSTAQQQYEVLSAAPALTRDRLSAIGPAPEGAVDAQFLALPETTPGIITETTAAVTADITNPYDQAIAIQDYLRGPEFIYSIDAPVSGGYDGNSLDVMARFLESKSGYCVHYAGTMAVMARDAGIPSRVAVGYAPGTPTGETVEGPDGVELTEFTVNSKDAHAWPELYFDGLGWVKFEPTPSRGVVPDYALTPFDPAAPAQNNDDLTPGQNPLPDPGATDSPTPGPEDPVGAPASPEQARQATIALTGALLVFGLLVIVPFLARTGRTGRRHRKFLIAGGGRGAATLAWAETVETAGDYGYPATPTDTPRTFARRVGTQAGFDAGPAESLAGLRRAYETDEYADPVDRPAGHPASSPGQGAPGSASGTAARWDDVEAVARALRESSSFTTRLRALFLPRSLWQRFGK